MELRFKNGVQEFEGCMAEVKDCFFKEWSDLCDLEYRWKQSGTLLSGRNKRFAISSSNNSAKRFAK